VHGLQAYARHADIVWVVGHGGREEGMQGDGISRTQWEPVGWSLGAVAVRCSQGHDGVSRGVARLWTLAVGHGLGHRPISDCDRHQWCEPMTNATQHWREARNQTRWAIRHAIGPAQERRPWGTRAGVEKRPAPVHDFLDVPDQRPHREGRLHQQAFLPLTALTPCEVGESPWRVRPGRRGQC
jgi:hypothetical protein